MLTLWLENASEQSEEAVALATTNIANTPNNTQIIYSSTDFPFDIRLLHVTMENVLMLENYFIHPTKLESFVDYVFC